VQVEYLTHRHLLYTTLDTDPQFAPKIAEIASAPVRFAGNFESLSMDVEATDACHGMAGTHGI
jgi:hypothetical protein